MASTPLLLGQAIAKVIVGEPERPPETIDFPQMLLKKNGERISNAPKLEQAWQSYARRFGGEEALNRVTLHAAATPTVKPPPVKLTPAAELWRQLRFFFLATNAVTLVYVVAFVIIGYSR